MLFEDISVIKGIGPARRKALSKLGINSVYDMLFYFPRDFEDRSQSKKITELTEGDNVCITAYARGHMSIRRINSSLTVSTMVFSDESGSITGVWYNNPYIKNTVKAGTEYTLFGRVSVKYGKKEIITPIIEQADKAHTLGKIMPVYPLTASVTQKVLSETARACLDAALCEVEDPIPAEIRKTYSLCEIKYALQNIHFPEDFKSAALARRRLVFEEFFLMRAGLSLIKKQKEVLSSIPLSAKAEQFISLLPFTPTGAQRRVINEIYTDIKRDVPMNRLLQGDVGSGKTAVAASLLFAATQNKMQGVIMAPTEILASQHYKNLKKLFPMFDVTLLTAHLGTAAKREALAKIADGRAQIIVGTHALIEKKVEFFRLGAVITDEQHRFGVKQRKALSDKGMHPHVLVMSATPIPRTLSLILYGDLDLSVIDELPPGREKIDTFAVGEDMRDRVYRFLRKNTDEGKQAYIVCPLVEESDKTELKNVTDFAKAVESKYFAPGDVAFLHGKMPAAEKEEIMSRFTSGEVKVLVSTTVIEVGVDVKNACIMIIENAERFGLSQLHQLRGRVGRGGGKSYCILFSESDSAKERMKTMTQTCDGFKIAEKDLELRGPGEFFGTRQHGLPELKIANIFTDMNMLSTAGEAVDKLISTDPDLSAPAHAPLKRRVEQMFNESGVLN